MSGTRQPLQPISKWWVIFGLFAVGLSIWASTWWLLDQTGGLSGVALATARMDAIKTGLSVGAGTGGSVALLLALRRQWLNERDQAHREQVAQQSQDHADRVASATEYDAAERRLTDLYVKAVDQLGHSSATVRLGGLYALERLAQNDPAHQQTVVNVLCAYLRMPYTPPAEPESAEQGDLGEEIQVRQAAQRILAIHLRHAEDQSAAAPAGASIFWPNIRVDLSRAHLVGFGFIDCRVASMTCNGTHFSGETSFRGLDCPLAFFQGAVFDGHADFRGITVDHAWFSNAVFADRTWFHTDEHYPHTRFGRHAGFRGTTFALGARFAGATFEGSAEFSGAEYGQGPESMEMDDLRITDPEIVSPEITESPSTWPPEWRIERQPGGTATLVRE
jgi:hypothetical protein